MATALVDLGDTIDHGTYRTRYGMDGDTYMSQARIGALATVLDTHAQRIGKQGWVTQAAIYHGLAADNVSYSQACMILAAAHITWSDLCHQHS